MIALFALFTCAFAQSSVTTEKISPTPITESELPDEKDGPVTNVTEQIAQLEAKVSDLHERLKVMEEILAYNAHAITDHEYFLERLIAHTKYDRRTRDHRHGSDQEIESDKSKKRAEKNHKGK